MTHWTNLRSSKSFQQQGTRAWNCKVRGIFKIPPTSQGLVIHYHVFAVWSSTQSFSIIPHKNSSSTEAHSIFVKELLFFYIIPNLIIKISWWNDTLHCCKHLLGLACPFGLFHSSQSLFSTSSQALYPEFSLQEMPDYSSHEDFFFHFLSEYSWSMFIHSFAQHLLSASNIGQPLL